MFHLKRHGHDRSIYADLSQTLEEEHHWAVGILTTFECLLDVSAFAIEPTSGLLAVGTSSGSVHLFGRPGVHLKLPLSQASAVKFLQFAPSIYRLVSVDSDSCLHVWDLAYRTPAIPKSLGSWKFSHSVNCLTASPSHSHAFIALQSGEVRTYDLSCMRRSPYTIPNLWTLHEKRIAPSGSLVTPDPSDGVPMDVVIHPRDLNLVFIAYGGGVVLFDLTRRSTLRVYELVLPPGAPGGSGYQNKDLLNHRRLSVTSLTVHPAGHVLCVGYLDGCIAFWAVEDEDQPLLVRTLENEDVNIVDGVRIDAFLSQKNSEEQDGTAKGTDIVLEPIFKLVWSDIPITTGKWGGETTLTILGGTTGHSSGVNILWNGVVDPPEVPPSTPGQSGIHGTLRTALRKWLLDSKTYFLQTTRTVQDFLVIPRNNPHFAGGHDPIAILFLYDCGQGIRGTEAYPFPPRISLLRPSDDARSDSDASIPGSEGSTPFSLPNLLLNSSDGILGGQIVKLSSEVYEKLVTGNEHLRNSLPLNGGLAWYNDSGTKLSKYQSPQLLVTEHCDLTIRFHDISARLRTNLQSSNSLIEKDFPSLLPELSMDLKLPLVDPLVAARISTSQRYHIASVHMASESLECAVILRTGELFVYRWNPGSQERTDIRDASDKELVILQHISQSPICKFHPFLMLVPRRGAVSAFSLSDIGFFAAGYADGSLFVVDMRTPRIIFPRSTDSYSKSNAPRRHSKDVDPVASLTWTVAVPRTDSRPFVLLVVVRQSGLLEIHKVIRQTDTADWVIDDKEETRRTVESPLPGGTFIIDSKTGQRLAANKASLAMCLQPPSVAPEMRGILVISGTRAVKCIADCTGERIGKTEWADGVGAIQHVEIVERMGYHALAAFTDRREILVYSLPYLKLLHRLQLTAASLPSAFSSTQTGNFVEWLRQPITNIVAEVAYASLFDGRVAYVPPEIDLESTKPTVPRQPQPVSLDQASILGYLLKIGNSTMTGDNVDALLAGPDRPQPIVLVREADLKADSDNGKNTPEKATQPSLYDRLTSAMNERGQVLEDLEERFNSLESGSKSMLAQAQRLAAKQKAKSWFGL